MRGFALKLPAAGRGRGSGFHGETQYADPSGRLAPPWFHPKITLDMGMGYGIPMGEVVVLAHGNPIPSPPALADLGKERVDGSLRSHRPSSQSVFWLDRRVNSAIRERGLRRSAARNYSAPVVTHCSIDPSTRTERTSFALRLRLRRRSRAAARPSACADTRAPSVANASRAC